MISGRTRKQAGEAGRARGGESPSDWGIFECLPVSAVIVGPDGLIKRVNRMWREFATRNGLQDLTMVLEGATYIGVCSRAAEEGDESAARALRGVSAILGGQSDHFSLEYPCHSQDTKRWFLMVATPAPAGHAVILHLDVTERRIAEEARIESERNFRLIAETIEDVFWIGLPGGEKIIYVSPTFEKIWGRARDGLYENSGLLLEMVHPEDRESVASGLTEHAEGRWNRYYRIIRPDGTIRWIHDRGFPIHDPQGRLLLMTGVATDVTERRKMEDEVRRSRDELELRVQERTKTLADTNAALRLLLKLREEDRQISREAVLANIKHSVQPYIEKLKSCRLSGEASTYLDLVETKINEIASSFIRTMSDKFLDLTPMEIRVGELIRDGRTTKEMAELLHLSPGTIRYHRENLRQKLGIKGKAFNLQTFLRNLQ